MSATGLVQSCPICDRDYPTKEIESHVNRCIFLNSVEECNQQKRKRCPSPSLCTQNEKSPLKKSSVNTNEADALSQSFSSPKPSTCNGINKSENQKSIDWSFTIPLAKQVQPKTLDNFFGQNHVLGKDTVLRNLLEKGDIPSMILWGPPGCGKTSLSNVVNMMCKENSQKFKFVSLCAANCGVKDVQNIVALAKADMKFGKRTILFMDEIHRFNKKQQDTFLLHVEKGEITLIGATTENPSFSINSALLSRCRVIVLEKLNSEDLESIIKQALESLEISIINEDNNKPSKEGVSIRKSAVTWLADISDGDARIALTNLQLVLQHNDKKNVIINEDDIKDGIKKSHLLYDKKGEEHYNIISAMHKSIRGSDDNAALYWTTRMIMSGEDPLFIARRLVRAASEDIGNADPNALQLAVSTMQGCQLIGMPEADVLLAQCAIYLARAPKSREADSALAAAKTLISNCKGVQPSVPMHIRNAPTKLMKNLGYGRLSAGATRTYMPPEYANVDFFSK